MSLQRLTLATALLCMASFASAADLRYVARFADGSRLEGNNFGNWHDDGSQPQLEGRNLVDPNNHFLWLRDRNQKPGPPPTAYIEMATGDRFPARVVGYTNGGTEFEPLPAHFIVDPATPLLPQHAPLLSTIRVVAAYVKRIVWQHRENSRYQPSTLLMRDGRALRFRAIRFDEVGASALMAEGNKRVPYNDIAEVHMPTSDFWQKYFDELATLSPAGTTRLYQLETTDGLILTGSKERMAIYNQGGEPWKWIHGLQPAWSLDVLYVPGERVWLRRSFAPNQVPLSRIPPSEVKHQAALGEVGQPWQRDRNMPGEPLRSGGREWGYGLGTTTTTELTYDLPIGAKTFKGSIGLDRVAGKGGCAKGQVFAGPKDVALAWESPPLVGSETAVDFGPLNMPSPATAQRLRLRSDSLHQGRPAGSDPFEVRDFLDWLDPLVEFDAAMLQPIVQKRIPNLIPAWTNWSVDTAPLSPDEPPKFVPFTNDKRNAYRTAVVLEQPLVLRRKLPITLRDNWLVVSVVRAGPIQGPEPRIEARIGGELVADWKVPPPDDKTRPLAISLSGYKASQRELDVELRLFSEPSSGLVSFRSIQTLEQLPTLYRVFEEQNPFTSAPGLPAASVYELDRKTGQASLKLPVTSETTIQFERPLRIREVPTLGEFRSLRFAVRKKGKGRFTMEFGGKGERATTVLYLGPENQAQPDDVKVHNTDIPDEWLEITRDLYQDFGRREIDSLTLRVPDGEFALIDELYLAASWDDFNWIPKSPPSEPANQAARTAMFQKVFDDAKAAMVIIDFGEGRKGSGMVYNYLGEIATPGHLVGSPKREVVIRLADGKEVKGETGGVNRETDIGYVKIKEEGARQGMPINHWIEPFASTAYGAVGHNRAGEAQVQVVNMRRLFNQSVWTTYDVKDPMTGGILFQRFEDAPDKVRAEAVGILTQFSPYGGGNFSRFTKFNEYEGRLKNGEVWGKWLPGSGPSVAFTTENSRDGAKVTALEKNGAAAAAGMQLGDLVVKVDNISTHNQSEIEAALAERDPGHEATFDLMRNGGPVQVKYKLAFRRP